MAVFRNLRTLDSLRVPIFRRYFVSRLFDASAMNIRQMALIILMYRITGSATLLGALVLARAIPLLLLSPLAGAVADRVQKKYLIIGSSIVDTAVTVGIAAGLMTGYISADHAGSWWVLIAAAVLNGMVTGTKGPSNDAMVIEVVGQERITNAIALTQMGQNLLRIISPAVAGVMIDQLGFPIVYLTMAGLYVGAVAFMWLVPPLSTPHQAKTNIFGDVRDVWNYILKQKDLLYILAMVFTMVFLSMPYRQLMTIFTDDVLMVGATGLGILNAVQGVGSIAGSFVLASVKEAKNRGRWLLISGLVLGISIAVFAFSKSWFLSLGIMLIVGLGQAGRMTLPVALLQSYSKNEFRGRIMSFYGVNLGLSSFGSFFAAILADNIGIQWSVGGLALGLIGVSILGYLFVPRIRNLQ
jgi:MFS family permease